MTDHDSSQNQGDDEHDRAVDNPLFQESIFGSSLHSNTTNTTVPGVPQVPLDLNLTRKCQVRL